MTSPAEGVRHRVFVFGTLKEGFPNFATHRGTRVPGVFKTRPRLPLYLVGERHVPWLLDLPGQGLQVADPVCMRHCTGPTPLEAPASR